MECSICDYAWCWSCGMNTKSRWHDVFSVYCQLYNNIVIENWNPFKKGCLLFSMVFFSPVLYLISCLTGGFYLITDCCCDRMYNFLKTKWKILNFFIFLPIFLIYPILAMIIGIIVYGLTIVPVLVLLILFLIMISIRWCFSSRKVK